MRNLLNSLGGEVVLLSVVLGVLLYLALLALGRYLKRELHIQFGGAFHAFAFLAGLTLALWLPYSAVTVWPPWLQTALRWLTALLAVWSAVVVSLIVTRAFLDRYLWERHKLRVPKLTQNLVAALLLALGIAFAIKVLVPKFELTGLLAGGAVLGIIFGLALQSLLADLFAGIALSVERPFQVGDWVQVSGIHGEVIETNWRATRLRTNDNAYFIIPNSAIAKDAIINFYQPNRRHALRIKIGVAYEAEPNVVKKVLADAVAAVEGVLKDREPTVRILEFGDSAITYEVKYWVDDHAKYQEYNDATRTALWYALKKANIKIPYPIREIHEIKV